MVFIDSDKHGFKLILVIQKLLEEKKLRSNSKYFSKLEKPESEKRLQSSMWR